MAKLLNEPTPENLDEYVRLLGEQAERQAPREFKKGAPGDLKTHKGIVANPNCTAAILGTAIWPLHQKAGIKRVIVSTYQSASGAGAQAMAELESQVRQHVAGEPITKSVFPHQIAFNVLPQVDNFESDGYTVEEHKMVNESRKILHDPALPLSATCVRVPVQVAHSGLPLKSSLLSFWKLNNAVEGSSGTSPTLGKPSWMRR